MTVETRSIETYKELMLFHLLLCDGLDSSHKWIAADADGRIFAYRERPVVSKNKWMIDKVSLLSSVTKLKPRNYWKDTLIEL